MVARLSSEAPLTMYCLLLPSCKSKCMALHNIVYWIKQSAWCHPPVPYLSIARGDAQVCHLVLPCAIIRRITKQGTWCDNCCQKWIIERFLQVRTKRLEQIKLNELLSTDKGEEDEKEENQVSNTNNCQCFIQRQMTSLWHPPLRWSFISPGRIKSSYLKMPGDLLMFAKQNGRNGEKMHLT